MRKHHLIGSILAIIGIAGMVLPARSQAPFTIRRPKDGDVFHEKVQVEVPNASIPDGGFVVFSVNGSFRVATAPPLNQRSSALSFVWDTRVPTTDLGTDGSLKERYTPDGYPKEGSHTIQATLYDASGVKLEESEVNVVLRNKIANPPKSPIRLAYRFRLDEQMSYTYKLEGDLRNEANEPLSQTSQIIVNADWVQRTEDIENGMATLSQKFSPNSVAMILNPIPTPLAIADQRLFASMLSSGRASLSRRSEQRGFFLVYYPIDLPARPVKAGDTWKGVVRLMVDPDTGRGGMFDATHTLVGFEWQSGLECAKIESVFKGQHNIMQRMASQGNISVEVEGVRHTFFAYKQGRIVKSVDKFTGIAMMPPGFGGGMGPGGQGGMPGMSPGGMPGGMGQGGMPGMGPGGMMGGMRPGGMPGMGQGGMPGGMRPGGMPGMGQGGMPGMMGGMPGAARSQGARRGGGMPGGMPGMGPGGMPGGMRPGGMPGGMPGGGMGGAIPAPAAEPVKVKFDMTATLELTK